MRDPMDSQPDFPGTLPPSYQSVFNGKLDPASEADQTQTSVGERSMDEDHDPYLGLAEPRMGRKDKLCFLGVILAFTVLICAFVASIVSGVSVVGPYSTAIGFVQTNCTNVSSTMGTEKYSCSCGRYCTKTCTRDCLRVNVSYTDQSSALDSYALLRPDESYLNTQCYSNTDDVRPILSPIACWYNPANIEQAIVRKKYQLYQAVNSLFWPLLFGVLSIAFIIMYYALLAMGRIKGKYCSGCKK